MATFLSDEEMQKLESQGGSGSEAGAFLSDEQMAQLEQEQSPVETSMEPAVGSAIGGGVTEAARRAVEVSAPKLKDAAESMEYRALGGMKTKEGRELLAKDFAGDGYFTPREIGRESLKQGGVGAKNPIDYRNILEEGNEVRAKAKIEGLKDIPGEIPVAQTYDSAQVGLGLDRLDPTNPERRDLANALERERKLAGPDIDGTRTVAEMEDLKTQLQNQAEKSGAYGVTSRAEAARSKVSSARARAAKDAVEQAILDSKGEAALEAFRAQKQAIGKNRVAIKILEQRALKDIAPEATINPLKLMDRFIAKRVAGPAAKGLDKAGDIAARAGGKIARKLPVIGAVIGGGLSYADAHAAGRPDSDAALEAAKGAITSFDPTGLVDATDAGPRAQSPEGRMEAGDRAGFLIGKAPDRLKPILERAAKSGQDALATTHRILMKQDPEYRAAIYGGSQQPQ